MIDKLVYINQMLNENLHYMYSINNVKFYEITSNDLEAFREELEILGILRKYLKVICCCEDKAPNEFISLKASIDKWGGERFSNYNDDEKVVSDFNKVKQWLEENKDENI